MPDDNFIRIEGAAENNLKRISLEIPKNKFVVVTGVSGSGKSSLVYDVIFREAENRYLGSFSSFARQFMGKMKRPDVESIDGLSPAIAVNQKTVTRNARSTVGTLTGIYDYLRLLFARFGDTAISNPDFKINRNLFSFNSIEGACPNCRGLGVEEGIDPDLLIDDPDKTLREGALRITTPSGYIIYSQVTMEVLNMVCESEGFHVDIPWKDLTGKQKEIVLYGSDKIEIPYGKHTLESRMKWSGITAKPRDTGFYKGIIPVMEYILKRDRNKNILRFARSEKCSVCRGKRLNEKALSVRWLDRRISELAEMSVKELSAFLKNNQQEIDKNEAAAKLVSYILQRTEVLEKLGTWYLSIDRESTSLSGGESQRLRLATQLNAELSGILYIFDEPSVGLHPSENQKMIEVLKQLRDKGNTVIVVEHEDDFIRQADHLIDIGPGAGIHGGELLINEGVSGLINAKIKNLTLDFLLGKKKFNLNEKAFAGKGKLSIEGAAAFNLDHIDVHFRLSSLNLITGVSGAGKSSLLYNILARFLQQKLHGAKEKPGTFKSITGWESIKKVIAIDQAPIGRSPRSNPATYTKLFDQIRNLFAALPEAMQKGWGKSVFSFNVQGGRCETCQGAGYRQVGMHFMGNVEILCESCNGKRFRDEILEIRYRGKNIYDVLELSIEEALDFFEGHNKIEKILATLNRLGLGYLKLGQRSTSLSGGEAQRVKLASELARPGSAHTLYILDEPTTGLHNADVKVLLDSLKELCRKKNTVLLIEHHMGMIASADHIVDLGPGSGKEGGKLIAMGSPAEILENNSSRTGQALKSCLEEQNRFASPLDQHEHSVERNIQFNGVNTHNLKNLDVSFPKNEMTVLTGLSGSGKSSLAFDTLYAEGRNRFLENYSPYVRSRIGMEAAADFSEVHGLTPTLAISRQGMKSNARSTVGTMTGIYEKYRLMYARAASSPKGKGALSSLFSFNHQNGACPKCDGLGIIVICDPEKLISDPEKPLISGAMNGSKTGKFYGDPHGQYVHTLLAAGKKRSIDFSKAYRKLPDEEKEIALYGTGEEKYKVSWKYKRGKRSGEHHFEGSWSGFCALVEEEYARKHADRRGESMMNVMKKTSCPACNGARLKNEALAYRLQEKNIAELAAMSTEEAIRWLEEFELKEKDAETIALSNQLRAEILKNLTFLSRLGLGYLGIDRVSSSLSGGEAQRVRLASQLGNGLTGMTFVLDEPTVGLHPVDVDELLKILNELKLRRNTLVVVEHAREVILKADHIIELGPGAGRDGGNIIGSGTPGEIRQSADSVTGKYLAVEKISARKRKILKPGISMKKLQANNLQIPFLHIPSGGIVALTGVSGSGKSTLMFDVLAASAEKQKPTGCLEIAGLNHFDQILKITQEEIIGSQSGNAATFTGAFDHIREVFASSPEARKQKLKKKHFSFNSKNGQCEKCQGKGEIIISLDFVTDVSVTCDACDGKRYKDEVLKISFNGKNIHDALEMTVNDAIEFFEDQQKIISKLQFLPEVGLGYLQLGQSTNTLSGGERQRLKIAAELTKQQAGKKLYLFDEPGTGLHFEDIKVLNKLFRKLSDTGHSILITEHDADIILEADWVIDLGPGGGSNGGKLMAEGSPEEIAKDPLSLTGRVLKKYF